MKVVERVFSPTKNRRLNELVGLLLLACALLLLLALASYTPLDPSLDTAGGYLSGRPAHNWVGLLGAGFSDLLLQTEGLSAFLLPLLVGGLGLVMAAFPARRFAHFEAYRRHFVPDFRARAAGPAARTSAVAAYHSR